MKKLLLATTAVLALAASPAHAVLSIAFQANGAGPVSACSDGAACDNSGLTNQLLQFNQVVGQFVVSGVLTESNKVAGANSLALTSLLITNTGGAGFLTFVAGDKNFLGPIFSVNESASGTFLNNVGATATLSFFGDAANGQPAGTTLATPGSNLFSTSKMALLNVDSQSGTNIDSFLSGGNFSMAEKAVLQFDAGGSVIGFSMGMQQVAAVPEPSTWCMMLLGFAGLAWAGMRKKSGWRTSQFA